MSYKQTSSSLKAQLRLSEDYEAAKLLSRLAKKSFEIDQRNKKVKIDEERKESALKS